MHILTIDKAQARRFLLAYHHLLPARRLSGSGAVLRYVREVNCIQYDPVNVVGQNPHLVLQARIRNYRPAMLDKALYQQRSLVDGFDKVMSIYPVEDWPYFAGHRQRMGHAYSNDEGSAEAAKLMPWVRQEIETRGPLCSLDLEDDTRMEGWWSNNTRAARMALDLLFLSGELVVHHRVGTRRYFDLPERLLAEQLHGQPEPHLSREAYQDWHILRRIGGLGLAHPRAGEHWGGMLRTTSVERKAAIGRLLEQGCIAQVAVEGLPKEEYYLRVEDLPRLQKAARPNRSQARAAFIPPLDNLLWDRKMVEQLFDFYYRWEVYTPAAKRQYGYYVLPVMYGERLVGRMDPGLDRASGVLTIKNWWWEAGVDPKDEGMLAAVSEALAAFGGYLEASQIVLGPEAQRHPGLRQAAKAATAGLGRR